MHGDEKHRIRKSPSTGTKDEPKGGDDNPEEPYSAANRSRFFHRALTCLDFLIHVEVRIPRFWIALVVMVLSSPLLHAQYAVPPWKAGPVDVSGILDGFYSENFNHPDCRINQLHNFDYYSARPRLNMAEVGLSHDPAPLGFEIDFGLGDTYKLVHSTEPDSPLKNILQLTVSLKPSAWHGVQVDFGKFQTSAGIESAETLSGWNYSRSILFVYAQPNYHFGLRSTVPLGKRVEVGLQVVNGWNRVLDGNGGKTIAVTADYKGPKLSWYNDYYIGPERVDGANLRRTLFDTTLVQAHARRMLGRCRQKRY